MHVTPGRQRPRNVVKNIECEMNLKNLLINFYNGERHELLRKKLKLNLLKLEDKKKRKKNTDSFKIVIIRFT